MSILAGPPRSEIGSRGFVIGALTLLALHITAGLIFHEFAVVSDGAEYVRMGEELVNGQGFTYDGVNPVVGKPPGMPILIAIHLELLGSLNGIHLVQLLLLFASFVTVAVVVRRFRGPRTGLITLAFLCAVEPLRNLAANTMSEPLFACLLGLGMLLLLRSIHGGSLPGAALSGFLFGLASCVRPISLFWPAALVLIFLAVDRRFLGMALVVAAVHVLTVTPWIVRNAVSFGRIVPIVENWGPMFGMSDEAVWRRYSVDGWAGVFHEPEFKELIGTEFPYNGPPQERLRNATLSGIENDVLGWAWRCIKQSANVWTYLPGTKGWVRSLPSLFWMGRGVMVIFYVISVLGAITFWKRERTIAAILIGHVIYTAILLFPVTSESRYLIPAYLWILPMTFIGLNSILPRLSASRQTP